MNSENPPLEIVLRQVESGWTWSVRCYGETIVRRGRAGNVCVAAMDAADALAEEKARTPALAADPGDAA